MKGKIGAILLTLIFIIGSVCLICCLEKVPAGYVGVDDVLPIISTSDQIIGE